MNRSRWVLGPALVVLASGERFNQRRRSATKMLAVSGVRFGCTLHTRSSSVVSTELHDLAFVAVLEIDMLERPMPVLAQE